MEYVLNENSNPDLIRTNSINSSTISPVLDLLEWLNINNLNYLTNTSTTLATKTSQNINYTDIRSNILYKWFQNVIAIDLDHSFSSKAWNFVEAPINPILKMQSEEKF